jgi:hypothetical protein
MQGFANATDSYLHAMRWKKCAAFPRRNPESGMKYLFAQYQLSPGDVAEGARMAYVRLIELCNRISRANADISEVQAVAAPASPVREVEVVISRSKRKDQDSESFARDHANLCAKELARLLDMQSSIFMPEVRVDRIETVRPIHSWTVGKPSGVLWLVSALFSAPTMALIETYVNDPPRELRIAVEFIVWEAESLRVMRVAKQEVEKAAAAASANEPAAQAAEDTSKLLHGQAAAPPATGEDFPAFERRRHVWVFAAKVLGGSDARLGPFRVLDMGV